MANTHWATVARDIDTDALRTMVSNHQVAIEADMLVGQIAMDRAHAFRIELLRREGVTA